MRDAFVLELIDVKKNYDHLTLLDGINFKLNKGERASLLGPGSSGKSTILKLVLGLTKPESGKVMLFGEDMVAASEMTKRSLLRGVGMAFQQGGLFDYMTVKENLYFAMEHMTDYDGTKMEETVRRLLETVKLPKSVDLYPYELSGGMQRRIGVARALATSPELAIFDEPTSGLDPVTSTIILNMIKELTETSEQSTALIATSSSEVAMRFADRIILINDGKVVADGSWKELLVKGDDWVKNFLGSRLKGMDEEYAAGLGLPKEFLGLI
jgi:phospholipid/cholesterol/gamma-HCH transport system ATP-binding protein